ncbi:LamB/YcsF family protein [Amycolatopsis nigrescens]|uniref:LamB/YcsF family protein n=1 Tax=Amycolatopsis nigrescens TaxID=381445 RepID=UPI000378BA2D|nr:5-oxoprolinase subunit PxpA [Amycolatopsis nigrescens]
MTTDLNSDLGEGFGVWTLGDDDALLDVVTSANVACGFHAGDPSIMRNTCARAAANGVAIGAQVSYRDLAGFGRRRIELPAGQLADDVTYQIGALDAFARAAGSRVAYVKPHGALYNTAVTDVAQAEGVVAGVRRFAGGLPVLGLPGSALLAAAEAAGLPTVTEAFADRAYTPEGHLVPRTEPDSVLHDAETIAARCVELVRDGTVTAVNGEVLPMRAQSLCVHGDTPGAVHIARAVRDALQSAGVTLAPFTTPGK